MDLHLTNALIAIKKNKLTTDNYSIHK